MGSITASFHRGNKRPNGKLICRPSHRHILDESIVLPSSFNVKVVNGQAIFLLSDTPDWWCWEIEEDIPGGITRYVFVSGDANYKDLVDVDPNTLSPTAEPEAAWWARAADLQAQINALGEGGGEIPSDIVQQLAELKAEFDTHVSGNENSFLEVYETILSVQNAALEDAQNLSALNAAYDTHVSADIVAKEEISDALEDLQAATSSLQTNKADAGHTHGFSDILNLPEFKAAYDSHVSEIQASVNGIDEEIGGILNTISELDTNKADNDHTHVPADISNLESFVGEVIDVDRGVPNGLATLGDDGKLTIAQLPEIAISRYLGHVESETAMLESFGDTGDWVTREDGTTWVLIADTYADISSWKQLIFPGGITLGAPGSTSPTDAIPGNDPRLTDDRTARAHTHPWSDISSVPVNLIEVAASAARGREALGLTQVLLDIQTLVNTTLPNLIEENAALRARVETLEAIPVDDIQSRLGALEDLPVADIQNRVAAIEGRPYHVDSKLLFALPEGAPIPAGWPSNYVVVRTEVV